MECNDIKRRIVDAVWSNPQLVYDIELKDKGANKKTSIHHPNGEKGKDWSAYALLKKDTTICANWKGSADDDLWQFVMAKESTTFMGAVKYLADIYGIPIELSAKDKEKAVMRSFNEVILHHCNKVLREDAIAEDVRQYLVARGLSVTERLGYWSNRVKDDVIRILDNTYVDIDKESIAKRIGALFPFNDDDYRLIIGRYNGNSLMGFCGRKTNKDAKGNKYIYSRSDEEDESNNPKGAFIKVTERMVVMEGMLDIESALQKGVNAFATGTSSITLAQTEELVRRGCREFVLIPDCELDEKESQPTELQHIKIRIFPQIGKRRMGFVGTSIDRILSVSTKMDEYVSISVSDISRWRTDSFDEKLKDVNDYIIAYPNADLMAEILDAKLSWYRYLCEMLAINSDDEGILARQIVRIFGAIPDKSEQNRFAMFVERKMSMGEFPYTKISECGITHEVFAEIVRKGISRTKSVLTDNYVTEINNAYNGEKMGNSDVYDIAQKLADVRKNDDEDSLYRQFMRSVEDIENDIAERGSDMSLELMLKDDEGNELRPITIPPVGIFVLTAMPKHGKTTLMINLARMITAKHEGLVLVCTNEQNQDDMLSKCYCMCADGMNMSGIERIVKDAKTGIDMTELPTIKRKYGEMFGNVKFARIDREIDMTIAKLRNSVNRIRTQGKDVSCIVLDYLQLMTHGDRLPRTEQLSYVMAQLNDLSNELSIPIITASQFNRDVRKGKSLDDISYADGSESKAIEEYASELYMLLNYDMLKWYIDGLAEKMDGEIGRRAERMKGCQLALGDECNLLYVENLLSRRNRIGGFACIELGSNGLVNGQL